MLCLKCRHRVLIYSLPLLFVVAFSLLFGHSSVFATSQSFSYDPVNNPISYHLFDDSEIGFIPSYVSVDVHFNTSPGSLINGFTLGTSSGSFAWQLPVSSDNTIYSVIKLYSTFTLQGPARFQDYSSLVITFYDSNPTVSIPCPECPLIPETQYGDVLDKIYHAIIFVPAMAFVLYLFYILYGWYVGGRR